MFARPEPALRRYAVWTAFVLGCAWLASVPAGLEPAYYEALAPPTWRHPLGTDLFGKDQLSVLLYATWNSVWRAALVATLSMSMGFVAAIASVLRPGSAVDRVIEAVAELLRAFPGIVAVLVFAAVGVPSYLMAAGYFSANVWRVARQQLTEEVGRPYVWALELAGLGRLRVIAVEAAYMVQHRMRPVALALFAEALAVVETLAFLGIAQSADHPSLGFLLRDGFAAGLSGTLLWIPAILALSAVPAATILLADRIERRSVELWRPPL